MLNVPLCPVHSLFHGLCVSLCIQFTASQARSQPAGSVVRHKEPSFSASPPTGITCFHSPYSTLLCISSFSLPSCSALNHMTLASPLSCSDSKVRPLSDTPAQTTNWTYRMYVFMQMCATPNEAAWGLCVWPYSVVQWSSWPGAACWPPNLSRPSGPVSCGRLECAEIGHRQR